MMRLDPKTILLGFVAFSLLGGQKKKGAPAPILKNGARLSLDELRALAQQTGFPDPGLAAAVAMAESGGYVGIVGDLDKGKSVGLWQINLPAHPSYDPAKLASSPAYNAQAAYEISKHGTDWSPWSAYNQGLYRQYMPAALAFSAAPPAQIEQQASGVDAAAASSPAFVDDVAAELEPLEHLAEPVDGIPAAAVDQVEEGDDGEHQVNGFDPRVRISAEEAPPRPPREPRARRGRRP
jgi:Lysozyme like domain